jgi:hypothetical protein
MNKQIKMSGYLGNVLMVPAEGKAYGGDGKEVQRTSFIIPLLSLDKFLAHSGQIKGLQFEDAYNVKESKKVEKLGMVTFEPVIEKLSKEEIELIKAKFKTPEVPKTKDEQIKELQDALVKSNELLEKLTPKKPNDEVKEALKIEYKELAEKEAPGNWGIKKLTSEIELLK